MNDDTTTLFQGIATTGEWVATLDKPTTCDNVRRNWQATAQNRLDTFEKMLPSGSGIDSGSTILEASADKIRIQADYHHMNCDGYYNGWTQHVVTIKPCLVNGFTIKINGRNDNEIKDYLAEVYDHALRETVAKYPEQVPA